MTALANSAPGTGPTSAAQYLLDSSREYAIYVCDTRGIPMVADGLKSGQRIALWLLRNRAEKIKTFALSGLMGFERLYVHGETSANGAISLLAAPYKNNIPLIEGLGQFGSRVAPDKDGIGAPRYTEVRRSKAAEAMLYKDLDIVPLEDNYDGSNKQPKHFLPLIPTVLLNGVTGVAVGYSTDILPRKLRDLIDATKAALLDQPIQPLVPHYARYNIGVKATGKPNQWEYSGKVEIVDTSTMRITELPPGFSIEGYRKTLMDFEDKGLINSFTDRSTETINITIKMQRGTIRDWTEEKALTFLKLREKTTERIVTIGWSGTGIKVYDSAEELVRDFAQWRLGWYEVRFQKLLADDTYELAYWKALRALFEGGFTKRLGTFVNKAGVEEDVVSTVAKKAKDVKLDAKQVERIVGLPTYRWTREFEAEIGTKIAALEGAIAGYRDTLSSPGKLKAVYLAELDALRSFRG